MTFVFRPSGAKMISTTQCAAKSNLFRSEVQALMALLKEFLRKEIRTLKENDIRFQTIGREDDLDDTVRREIEFARRETANNKGTILNIALNYSGRSDIV